MDVRRFRVGWRLRAYEMIVTVILSYRLDLPPTQDASLTTRMTLHLKKGWESQPYPNLVRTYSGICCKHTSMNEDVK